jgi:hypothetical protein
MNQHLLCRSKLANMEQKVRCCGCVLREYEGPHLMCLAVVDVRLQLLHPDLQNVLSRGLGLPCSSVLISHAYHMPARSKATPKVDRSRDTTMPPYKGIVAHNTSFTRYCKMSVFSRAEGRRADPLTTCLPSPGASPPSGTQNALRS